MNANSDKDYLDAKVEAVRAGMDGRLDTFEENVNGRFAGMNATFDKSVAELLAKIDKLSAELCKEIADVGSRMVQWMVGLFLASMAIFITMITFVLNNAVRTAAPATPPVIIQLSPQGVTFPVPAAPAPPPPAVKPRP